MSKPGSVAPKERVNIRFEPATDGGKTEVELPLKLFVLGDFTGRPEDLPVEKRKLSDVNADNFDEVLESQNLSLDLKVDNRIDPDQAGPELTAQLTFRRLRDFEPDAIVRQVPEMRRLLELREALVALKGPLGNVPAFRRAIQAVLDDAGARGRLIEEVVGPGRGQAPPDEAGS